MRAVLCGFLVLGLSAWRSEGSLLNPAAVDLGLFRVTPFASGQSSPGGIAMAPDGSYLIATWPNFTGGAILRFTDQNLDGLADGPGVAVFSGAGGPYTSLVHTGKFVVVAQEGAKAYTFLAPGASPNDPYSVSGTLQLSYPGTWDHDTLGMTIAPVAGDPGKIDLFFNVGSQFNDASSGQPVGVQGLGLTPVSLTADALYRVRIDQSGGTPVAVGAPVPIATGIRNVYGMAFDGNTGSLYFADNAIDNPTDRSTGVPPQADELNVLTAGQLAGGPVNFGYPDCYIAYLSGAAVGSGCQQPLVAFQPINGARTEGAAGVALAPPGFPAPFANGIFTGLFGYPVGLNTQSGVVYYDLGTGQYLQFVAPSNPDSNTPISLFASGSSLFLSDFRGGTVWQVTSAIPEPGTLGLLLSGVAVALWLRRRDGFR